MNHPVKTGVSERLLETHVVRSIRLLAAPRPPGSRVVRTPRGEYRVATEMIAPRKAIAAEGECRDLLAEFDGDERRSAPDSTDLAEREDSRPPAPGVNTSFRVPEREADRPECREDRSAAGLVRARTNTPSHRWLSAARSSAGG